MPVVARTAAVAAALLFAAACASDDGSVAADSDGDGDLGSTITVPQVESSAREDVPSALDDPRDESFSDPLIDPDAIRSGGPPPDGIPPIDEPRFVAADDVDFLEDTEPVLALTVGEETRAYPVQVLIWHEIVNDTLDGVPVSVTYCPLCNSSIAYDRRLDGRVLDFGTSGQLFNSALVMYDRQTESLWSHFTGEAVVGHLTGAELETFPMSTVGWATFRDANPDALVLSRETGFSRRYGSNPYPGYDDVESSPFLFDGVVDDRLAAKDRVIGIADGDTSIAVHLDLLRDERIVEVDGDDEELIVWHVDGSVSALDRANVADGRDVGSTGVFSPVLDGDRLEFRSVARGFEDAGTGSVWNILGEAVSGPLAGERLTQIEHVDTFWFAWAAFQPDTRLVA